MRTQTLIFSGKRALTSTDNADVANRPLPPETPTPAVLVVPESPIPEATASPEAPPAPPAVNPEHLSVTSEQEPSPALLSRLALSELARATGASAESAAPTLIDKPVEPATPTSVVPKEAAARKPPPAATAPFNVATAVAVKAEIQRVKSAAPEDKAAGSERLHQHLRFGALVVVAAVTIGVAIWSWLPKAPISGGGNLENRVAPRREVAGVIPAATPSERGWVCLSNSTQSVTSAERDLKLRKAIAEFDAGHKEQAHALFKDYVEMACDRATLEAVSILERQIYNTSER